MYKIGYLLLKCARKMVKRLLTCLIVCYCALFVFCLLEAYFVVVVVVCGVFVFVFFLKVNREAWIWEGAGGIGKIGWKKMGYVYVYCMRK